MSLLFFIYSARSSSSRSFSGPSSGYSLSFSHMTLSLQMIMCSPAADLQLQPDYLQNYSLPLSSESHLSISAWIIYKHLKLLTSKIGDYPPQTCTFSTLSQSVGTMFYPVAHVRNLGVFLASSIFFNPHSLNQHKLSLLPLKLCMMVSFMCQFGQAIECSHSRKH